MHFRFWVGLLVFGLAAGCKAQITLPTGPDPALDHRIEVLVRSQFSLPPNYDLRIGPRSASQFAGYQTLPITITNGSKSQEIDFLISADNAKLVHLDTLDLTKDPPTPFRLPEGPSGQSGRQSDGGQLRRLGMWLLRDDAPGTISGHVCPL